MEELTAGFVFRLVTVKDEFPATSRQLHVGHIQIEDEEEARAARLERDPMFSVWDCEKTSIAQVRHIRGSVAETAAFSFDVGRIRFIRVVLPITTKLLRVFRDPLDPPGSGLPGASGHCGISGLYRRSGEEKEPFKRARQALASISQPYSDSDQAERW
jgi:hypothetical protein